MSREEALACIEADTIRRLAQRKPPKGRKPTGCTINTYHYPGSIHPVPMLRLRGHWLTEMGFPVGSKLRVCVKEGRLIVSVESAAERH